MRKLLLVAGLALASGLALSEAAAAADEVKAIGIVKNADGKFVFTDPNAKIKQGQTVKWVAVDSDAPHQLVPDSDSDALADTGTFDSTSSPSQKLSTAGTIHYHCAVHPKSMRGTINVAATDAPAPGAEAPATTEQKPEKAAEAPAEQPEKKQPAESAAKVRKPKPDYGSYGYGY